MSKSFKKAFDDRKPDNNQPQHSRDDNLNIAPPSEIDYNSYESSLKANEYFNVVRDVVFLDWCKNSPIKSSDNGYPKYFYYDFNIELPIEFHKDLIDRDLLLQASREEAINSYEIGKLKEICEELSLDLSDNKKELVEIIKSSKYKIKEPVYILSPSGREFLEQYKPFIKFYKSQSMSISYDEFIDYWIFLESFKDETPSYEEIALGVLDKKVDMAIGKRMYKDLTFNKIEYFSIIEKLEINKEKKSKKLMELALEIIILTLSGLDNPPPYNFNASPKIKINLAPKYCNTVLENKRFYNDNLIHDIIMNLDIKASFISPEEMRLIINDLIENPKAFDYYIGTFFMEKPVRDDFNKGGYLTK